MDCLVCVAPDRESLDASLRDVGLRPTQRAHPAWKLSQLRRHRGRCLGLAGAPGVEPPEDEPVTEPEEEEPLALLSPHPSSLTAVDRVRHVADLILTRRWSPAAAHKLAETWGVGSRAVRSYASAAGAALVLDRGSLEVQRAAAIADAEHLRDLCLDGEEPDLKAALGVEVHLAKIRGLLTPAGPLVQVNVSAAAEHDELDGLLDRLFERLRPWPDAAAAVAQVFAEADADRRRTIGVIDVQGEVVE